ncbi:hypothetical protein, partial [Micromonospora globispora]|uniref:hypothetical protein n=1 Tax=Micromonospora globispora TaxID=1450148 RepID=UPI001A9CAE6B
MRRIGGGVGRLPSTPPPFLFPAVLLYTRRVAGDGQAGPAGCHRRRAPRGSTTASSTVTVAG